MADGLHVDGDKRGDLGSFDPEGFGRRIRRFALDAHRILGRPDIPVDEAFALHARAWFLLREAPGGPSGPLQRWLVAAREAIDARLRAGDLEELESLVV